MTSITLVDSGSVTMTSREIADLTGKEHKHVLRDIRSMLEQLSLAEEGYAQNWTDPQNGQTYPQLALPKDLTITLISGYNVTMRHRIVKRWQELEAKSSAPAIPQSLPEALRLAAQAMEDADRAKAAKLEAENRLQLETARNEQLSCQVAESAPKAAALDRIAKADGSFCLTDAAKALQLQPKKFTNMLQELQWIHRRPMGSGWLAYQHRIQQGLLEHKVTTGERSDGSEWTSTQVRVTSKGMAKIAEILEGQTIYA